jgi:butyryl-CoA dehydrogenase
VDYFLTEEQQMIKDLAAQIAREKIAPVALEYDEAGKFPWDIVEVMAKADLFRVFIPKEYDGLGGGIMEMAIVVEELSKACGGISLAYAASGLGTIPISCSAARSRKKYRAWRWARSSAPRVDGSRTPVWTFGGQDGPFLRVTAISHRYQAVDPGGEPRSTRYCLTDPNRGVRGASAILVEKDTPGFEFGKKENKMGIRASATRELIFQDCKVPKSNLLGREGAGFLVAMKTFDQSRPGVAAQAVGIAAGALEKAVAYAQERKQFGKPVSSFQGLQFMLADMATQVEAARALTYAAARFVDSGAKNVAKISSMAKVFASDTAMRVTTDAVQVFGGYGYMKEYPVEKMMRDAKITQIYEGTNQIQREVIALQLIKESLQKKE